MPRRHLIRLVVTVIGIAVVVLWIANGPLYGRYSASECLAAYAEARTQGDSARVDRHPYHSEQANRGRHYCGEVRAQIANSAERILGR